MDSERLSKCAADVAAAMGHGNDQDEIANIEFMLSETMRKLSGSELKGDILFIFELLEGIAAMVAPMDHLFAVLDRLKVAVNAQTINDDRGVGVKGAWDTIEKIRRDVASDLGRNAAMARHSQPGGSHDKRDMIRKIWAEGRYSTRDMCAEKEHGKLHVSFSTARAHLKGTPDPKPWPGKRKR